jgi:hypothetical protein
MGIDEGPTTRGIGAPRRAGRPRQGARVALVDRSSAPVPFAQLEAVAAALRTQLERDFTPAWGIRATVVAVRGDLPDRGTWWPIRLVDPQPGFGGVHLNDRGIPYAEVVNREEWTRVASHELLEMLVDPLGRRFQTWPSIDPVAGGRLVHYLVEVCDPTEAWGYVVEGVTVSDFATPAYFGLEPGGSAFDAIGRLTRPFEVPAGGSLTWWDRADGRWHQALWGYRFITGEVGPSGISPREARDVALRFRRARPVAAGRERSMQRSSPARFNPRLGPSPPRR